MSEPSTTGASQRTSRWPMALHDGTIVYKMVGRVTPENIVAVLEIDEALAK